MAANSTSNSGNIIRSELWQAQLEEILFEQLTGVPFVRQLDFPDGTAFTIPSIGTSVVRDLPEGTEATFDAVDTGEVQVTLNDPVISASSFTKVLMEDSLWASQLMSQVPVNQAAAIMERFETDTLALQSGQTADDLNTINGGDHRFVANGTNEVIVPADFARVNYALGKAKIPDMNRMGVVDPSVAFALETSTNITNVSNNPMWEGIIETGITKNMRFVRNVYGIDLFVSNLLATANETIDSKTTAAGVANVFMSVARDSLLPFGLAWRRRPILETEVDFHTGNLEVKTEARWGSALIREENLVVVLTDTDQV